MDVDDGRENLENRGIRKHVYPPKDINGQCKCYGRPTVCNICQKRPKLNVNKVVVLYFTSVFVAYQPFSASLLVVLSFYCTLL